MPLGRGRRITGKVCFFPPVPVAGHNNGIWRDMLQIWFGNGEIIPSASARKSGNDIVPIYKAVAGKDWLHSEWPGVGMVSTR